MNIAVSNITMLPYSLSPNYFLDTLEELDIGAQLVPSYNSNKIATRIDEKRVVSIEPAWSKQTFYPRVLKDPKGALINYLVFGGVKTLTKNEEILQNLFPEALHIDFPNSGIVEVAKRSKKSTLNDFIGKNVVLDSYHIKEFGCDDPLDELFMLSDHSNVVALHLQTGDSDEVSEFIKEGTGYLSEFLKTFGHLNVPIVIEMKPWITNLNRTGLEVIVNRIRDIVS